MEILDQVFIEEFKQDLHRCIDLYGEITNGTTELSSQYRDLRILLLRLLEKQSEMNSVLVTRLHQSIKDMN